MRDDAGILNNIRVASPCSASWEEMEGDDRSRFCRQCRKNVYNLSAMSAAEAEALVREKDGRLCGRFYHRRDGTLLTTNCPVGLARMRRALLMQAGAITAVFTAIPAVGSALAASRWRKWPLWDREPFHSFAVRAGIIEEPTLMMGDVAIAPVVRKLGN